MSVWDAEQKAQQRHSADLFLIWDKYLIIILMWSENLKYKYMAVLI